MVLHTLQELSQTSLVGTRQRLEMTEGRAVPVEEDVNELGNLPIGNNEFESRNSNRQNRFVVYTDF